MRVLLIVHGMTPGLERAAPDAGSGPSAAGSLDEFRCSGLCRPRVALWLPFLTGSPGNSAEAAGGGPAPVRARCPPIAEFTGLIRFVPFCCHLLNNSLLNM